MANIIGFVCFVAYQLLGLLSLCIIVWALLSWLVVFNVVNMRNDLVRKIVGALDAVVRPVLRPVQRIVPMLGGFDISPIIVLIVIEGIRHYLLAPFMVGVF